MNGAQQQTIYTIHESQMSAATAANNNGNGAGNSNNNGPRRSSNDILIDTSSIPMANQQQPLLPTGMIQPHQHQHQQQPYDAITSQPAGLLPGSARVAPESQPIVYSVHPVFAILDQHETLLVRQRAEPASTCCGFESANSYTVRAKDGTPLLKAIENSNCCERCCFEGNREFNLSLVHQDEIVARIRKPYRVSRFCCYTNAVRIESPEDNPIGQIKQMFSLFGHPRYAIYDSQSNTPTFYIESTSCRYLCTPLLCTCICGITEFRIVSIADRNQVGSISRRWSELELEHERTQPSEPFGSASSPDQLFGIQFSANLEARHKVLLLSACFMLDFFYFESDRRRKKLASC